MRSNISTSRSWGLRGLTLTGACLILGVGCGPTAPSEEEDGEVADDQTALTGARRRNVAIDTSPDRGAADVSVVASPRHPRRLVIATKACDIYRSQDGGATWIGPLPLPRLPAEEECSSVTLAYAPDGVRLYYARVASYQTMPRVRTKPVVFGYSDDDGANFSDPADTGLPPGFSNPGTTSGGYGRLALGTHRDNSQREWVYVAGVLGINSAFQGSTSLSFTRSDARGAPGSFSPVQTLARGGKRQDSPGNFVAGAQVRGGPHGAVLVAWLFWSDELAGGFQIQGTRSADHGTSFAPAVTVASDGALPPSLVGPCLGSFGGSMLPSLDIDHRGAAHIAYTHAPDPTGTDRGDIRYVHSAGPPYADWSAPVTIAANRLAQGFPVLRAQHRGRASVIHLLWQDHRLSPEATLDCADPTNARYDIFYSRRGPGGRWSEARRVSDVSSRTGISAQGGPDLAVSNGLLYGAWPDRRDATSAEEFDSDLFGTRL